MWQELALWAAGLFGAGLLLARGVGRLAGPVFFFDAVRAARRGWPAALRCLYAGLLLLVLALFYARWFGHSPGAGLSALAEPAVLPPNEVARFAASFFYTFLAVQYAVVLVVTPAYAAGAIADEKQTRTLEYLLTTDLGSTEIILGKLASRVAHLVLLLLTGLPVLSLLQLLGGVDPRLLIAGFAGAALMMLSVASLAVMNSVRANRARDAAVATYAQVAAYHLVSGVLCCGFFVPWPPLWSPKWLLGICNSGNVVAVFLQLQASASRGRLPEQLPFILVQYALFHGAVTACCAACTVAWLRRNAFVNLPREEGSPRQGGPLRFPPRSLAPPLGDSPPMLWKELHAEAGLELPPSVRMVLTLFSSVGLWIAGMVFLVGLASGLTQGVLPSFGKLWTQVVGTTTLSVALLGIALRAAGALSSERERQTQDSLLTTDLTNREILGAKWLASFWSVRVGGAVLGAIVTAGVLTGGVFLPAVVLLAATCAASGAFAANLGLYCSLVCRTSLRATVVTVVVFFGVAVGHWLVYLCASTLLYQRGDAALLRMLSDFHTYGLTPPLTFAALTISFHDVSAGGWGEGMGQEVYAALVGVLFYAALAGLLWWRLRCRFARLRRG